MMWKEITKNNTCEWHLNFSNRLFHLVKRKWEEIQYACNGHFSINFDLNNLSISSTTLVEVTMTTYKLSPNFLNSRLIFAYFVTICSKCNAREMSRRKRKGFASSYFLSEIVTVQQRKLRSLISVQRNLRSCCFMQQICAPAVTQLTR